MTEFESIFNPADESLESRIDAYKRVHQDWLNAEASLKYLEEEEWGDTLGNREEVKKALDISSSSLYFAAGSFTRDEIFTANKEQLLEADEAQELLENKQYYELQKLRSIEEQEADSLDQSR